MKQAIICIIPAIILACQNEPTVLTNIGAITFGVLAVYFVTKYDKERSNKEYETYKNKE